VSCFLGIKFLNCGAVCASPQILVLDRSWKQAENFVGEIQKQLNSLKAVAPYYPGTQDRLEAMRKNCPAVQVFPKSNMHVIFDIDAEGSGGDYILKNEVFGPGFAIKFLEGKSNPMTFLEQAVSFSNEKLFGSLSCTIAIDPRVQNQLAKKFDEEVLYNLNWGTIGVNVWAGYMVQYPTGRWGAPSNRHEITDIQSGIGGQGNCLLLENVHKGVINSKWGDTFITTMMQSHTGGLNASFAKLTSTESVSALFEVGLAFGKAMFSSPAAPATTDTPSTVSTTATTTAMSSTNATTAESRKS